MVVARCAQNDGHGADRTAAAQLVYEAGSRKPKEADCREKNEAADAVKCDAGGARRAMFETKMVQSQRRRELPAFGGEQVWALAGSCLWLGPLRCFGRGEAVLRQRQFCCGTAL